MKTVQNVIIGKSYHYGYFEKKSPSLIGERMLKKEVKGDFDFFNIIMISEDRLLWVDLEINGGEELMKWWLKYANPTCCGGLGGVTAYQLHH